MSNEAPFKLHIGYISMIFDNISHLNSFFSVIFLVERRISDKFANKD